MEVQKPHQCSMLLSLLSPWQNERMSREKGSFQKEMSSSQHQFSGDMFVFRVICMDIVSFVAAKKLKQPISLFVGDWRESYNLGTRR